MEWITLQHVDLKQVARGFKAAQPHCGAFHPSQPWLSLAVDQHIVEFDVVTGCKLSVIDIGASIARMAYSPAGGHILVLVLEDGTVKSCDFDTEHTLLLYSPEKREKPTAGTEVHIAVTPLQPVVFVGFHRHMSVTVIWTIEGGKPPARIKTDLKKPVVNLACHPRSPILYVAYADGLIRAYNFQTFAVHHTLQIDNSLKLTGAGAFAFHPSLEWVFVGDRRGTLLAWDVSVPTRPNMIGITQVGSAPIASIAWDSVRQFLVTLSKEGALQVWRMKVIINPNRPPMRANFFETAGVESIDIARVLSQMGCHSVYPLPYITDVLVHPKLNTFTVLFSNVSGDDSKNRGVTMSREARKQLFAVLQSARGSPGAVLKEKLSLLGSAGILADHHLQVQLQIQQAKRQSNLTVSDIARKAFLQSHLIKEHARSDPISRIPLLTIADKDNLLYDVPVCQPFHPELNFFNKEHRTLHYPVRAFFMDGCNLTAYNLSSGEYNIYKKFSPTALGGNERYPTHMLHSTKQSLFIIFFEVRGATNEAVLYRDALELQASADKVNTLTGCDGAFIGPKENQYVILDDERSGLTLYFLESVKEPNSNDTNDAGENHQASNRKSFSEAVTGNERASMQFAFDHEVQRIFSTPLESTIIYIRTDSHIGFAKLFASAYQISNDYGQYISTRPEADKCIRLKTNERVLQVQWQETRTGQVAGIMTTHRVMIASANLEILACTSITFDTSFPPYRSLLWLGPSLLFSTQTSVGVLGWDGIPGTIATISTPYAALIGALNDRLLFACPTETSPRQKQGVEIRTRLVGLLEPLLIGWVTMQRTFDRKLDLSEILYQLTSRFDNLRLTPRSVDVLANGPPVCGDLALALAQAGPQFTQLTRCNYAIKAHRFSTALAALKDEFLRSRDYPNCPPTSRLFHRFRQLGQICIKFGQFDSAKETFEVVSDFQSMLDLFICHLNPSALRRLAQKLEEIDAEPELRRQLERILRVRSTGWNQGIFANFAAESMVPKGAEWGGGNWEIKTPESKSIPQWGLSGDVVSYMRTSAGPIPSIIADHIGVYLGAMKGRGTVIDVRDDTSLVPLAKGMNGEQKAEAAPPDLLKFEGKSFKKSESLKGSSAAASTSLMAAFQGDNAADLQKAAAEEFMKPMYGANDSSSDEDETSQRKKKLIITIRDKPAAGATVDVNKLKEATKQFKIGDALPQPRTRTSSAESQDLSVVWPPPLPSPSTSSTVQNGIPAGTVQNGIAAGTVQNGMPAATNPEPAPMMTGMGVAVGPIPEDFFQNTISSFQMAATLSQPVGLTQLQNQPARVSPNETQPAAPQGNVSDPFGNGVPPQVPQATAVAATDVTPKQASVISSGVPLQRPSSAAPIDLGILEGSVPASTKPNPSAENAGQQKAGGRPTSPPTNLRPGQVPRGAAASKCFKAALAHLEQNQLSDAMSCLDEAFLALAKDQSLGVDIKAQASICAHYKVAVLLLQEILRLQRVQGASAVSAKEEMARLSRHLSSLPLRPNHRISCVRTAIKRNMDVQNYAFAKSMLDLLLSRAPPHKQDELRGLINVCIQRGLTDKSIDPNENASQFCAATLGRLPTIGYDVCDLCGAKFSALSSPGCIICGMGSIQRSDAVAAPTPSPFG